MSADQAPEPDLCGAHLTGDTNGQDRTDDACVVLAEFGIRFPNTRWSEDLLLDDPSIDFVLDDPSIDFVSDDPSFDEWDDYRVDDHLSKDFLSKGPWLSDDGNNLQDPNTIHTIRLRTGHDQFDVTSDAAPLPPGAGADGTGTNGSSRVNSGSANGGGVDADADDSSEGSEDNDDSDDDDLAFNPTQADDGAIEAYVDRDVKMKPGRPGSGKYFQKCDGYVVHHCDIVTFNVQGERLARDLVGEHDNILSVESDPNRWEEFVGTVMRRQRSPRASGTVGELREKVMQERQRYVALLGGVASGLDAMHKKSVFHNQVHSSNVLVMSDDTDSLALSSNYKISGFSRATIPPSPHTYCVSGDDYHAMQVSSVPCGSAASLLQSLCAREASQAKVTFATKPRGSVQEDMRQYGLFVVSVWTGVPVEELDSVAAVRDALENGKVPNGVRRLVNKCISKTAKASDAVEFWEHERKFIRNFSKRKFIRSFRHRLIDDESPHTPKVMRK